jgi:hypothetical protein
MADDSSSPSSTQAMNIREQIGYPDYILEDNNKHLDEEYSSVRTFSAPPARPPAPQSPVLSQPPPPHPGEGGIPCKALFCSPKSFSHTLHPGETLTSPCSQMGKLRPRETEFSDSHINAWSWGTLPMYLLQESAQLTFES